MSLSAAVAICGLTMSNMGAEDTEGPARKPERISDVIEAQDGYLRRLLSFFLVSAFMVCQACQER